MFNPNIIMYAQFDDDNICTAIAEAKVTDVIATIDNLGMRYVDGVWSEVEKPATPKQPSNTEIAQLISDLQADLIIAGVI